MKEWHKAVIVSLVLMWIFLSMVYGSFNPMEWSIVNRPSGQPPGGTPPTTEVAGMFDVKVVGYNTLDLASSLTLGTNYNCFWYANRGGWMLLGSGSATIEVTPQDLGYVYAVVKIPAGQSYYVDAAQTKQMNPRVASVSYEDVDNDGYKEFTFRFSMADIPKPGSGNPTVTFYPYFLAYEKPAISAPADITGVGTAAVDKYIEWYLSFTNTKKAYGIVKVEFAINTTDTTKIQLSQMNIPGVGYLTGDQFGAPYKGTSSLTWTYTIGANLYQADYIKYGSNQLNKFDFTTKVKCQLAAGDTIQATITIYGITVTGTLETITDTVNISA